MTAASRGDDAGAAEDLAAYVSSPAAGSDRGQVLRAIEALRQARFSPSGALARGAVPGFGQFFTGRPVLGLAVLGGATGSAILAFLQRGEQVERRYVADVGGAVYYDTVTVYKRPYLAPGLAAAGAITLAGALEAWHFASAQRRERPRVVLRAAAMRLPGADGSRVPAPGLRVSVAF
jgi:hypothetical protein